MTFTERIKVILEAQARRRRRKQRNSEVSNDTKKQAPKN